MFKKIALTVASFAMVLAMPLASFAQSYDTSLYDATNLGSSYDFSAYTDEEAAAAAAAALAGSAMFAGVGIVIWIVSMIIGLAMYIYYSLALSTIAKKLGMANTWFAWIPILNLILMAKIAEINPAMILIFIIPLAGQLYMLYFMAVVYMKMCEKRGLDKYLGLLIFIPIANFVLPGYLAWAKITPKQATPVAQQA